MNDLIQRINELAQKAKSEGLTPTETKERDELRRKYIDLFKNNLRQTLENTTFVDESGQEINFPKKSNQ